MPVYIIPTIDVNNPLYCPSIPAALYLKSLRGRSYKSGRSHRRPDLFQSFARKLDHHFIQEKSGNYLASPSGFQGFRLQSNLSFSDLDAPSNYARSQPSFHDSSFDIEVQHEKLEYFLNVIESSPQKAPQNLRAEIPEVKTLADRLDSALPGIRLRERLLALKHHTPEALMDFMAENGRSYDCCLRYTHEIYDQVTLIDAYWIYSVTLRSNGSPSLFSRLTRMALTFADMSFTPVGRV